MTEMGFNSKICQEFLDLVQVVAALRQPDGCPWDISQTHQTLLPFLIQESYELIEAVEENNDEHLCEELGDVLLQIMLHGQIARERGSFDVGDICRGIKEKMVRRHPHVFGDRKVADADEVKKNWEIIKRAGKKKGTGILEGVSSCQPALLEAGELQKRAAAVGFDWEDVGGALAKVEEEIGELKEALAGRRGNIEEEIGDLLFAVVNVARFFQFDGEIALNKANRKFRHRFAQIEKELAKRDLKVEDASLDEMNDIWEATKKGGED